MGLRFADLLPDYKASLNDAASVFTAADDADYKRHLSIAAAALSREKRPRTVAADLTVTAGVGEYTGVPADLIAPKVSLWNNGHASPWTLPPGPLPTLSVLGDGDGRVMVLQPAPTAAQIACFGATYRYYYLAEHAITTDAATSTLLPKDKALLILRAQIEAMRELSFRAYKKPITLRAGDGVAGGVASKNQTPPALWDLLRAEYEASP